MQDKKRGDDLREKVLEALSTIPGGEELDRYFGISSGKPEQPAWEAGRSAKLISKLETAGENDSGALLDQIAEQGEASFADPNALRALMQPRSPQSSKFQEKKAHIPELEELAFRL